MMRTIIGVLMACGLTACQTPPPVREMSGLVAKFSAQMDSTVSKYVAALNESNAADAPALQKLLSVAARTGAANADELAVWNLASGPRASNVTRTLGMVSAMSVDSPDPLTGAGLLAGAAAISSTPEITFDDTPLKTIGTVAGNLSTPKSKADQFKVFGAYAKQVQSDLQQAAKQPAPAK